MHTHIHLDAHAHIDAFTNIHIDKMNVPTHRYMHAYIYAHRHTH